MRLFRDSVENLNVSRLKMSSKAAVGVGEVGVLKPARVRARNSAKHQERGGWVGAPYQGFRFKTAAEQGCDWETTAR